MSTLDYDITSPQSILNYARGLSGKSLSEAVDLTDVDENLKNKGNLGSMVERFYFKHIPPNNHDPDFAEAGVELKTTGVKKNAEGQYKAKERLVLSMINYMTFVDENWPAAIVMRKCRLMLLLFYLYEKVPVYERKFVFEPLLWSFPEVDLRIIEQDWLFIQKKIKDGKAHELSEGDTYYLGACRKGPGGPKEPLKQQPFSSIGAKARAFSLKPSYVNTIIDGYATESEIIESTHEAGLGIEKVTRTKFEPYIGMPVEDIAAAVGLSEKEKNYKAYYRTLTMRILGSKKKSVPEFDKAGVELKTIRLQKNGIPKEAMSFPAFSYLGIVSEDWEHSLFCHKLEQKFFFVIFKYDEKGVLRLHKVMYWNMPFEDREEAQKVWELTKQRVVDYDDENLPKSSESPVAHVRPHGRNSADTLPTPSGKMLPKKGFWLNAGYLAAQVNE